MPLGAEEESELDLQIVPGEKWQQAVEQAVKQAAERPRKMTRRVTLDQALQTKSQLMILGDPGAGKSTLLRYLTLLAARALQGEHPERSAAESKGASPIQETRLPILIPLRRFAAAEQSLVEFFYSYAKQVLQLDLPSGFFERALEDGRCLVCLDGLDEVFVSDQRVTVRDAVAALATRYPRNRFLVTSRIVGYESAPLDRRAFVHHTVLPFTESEIETFVHKWYTAREREPQRAQTQAKQLCDTIHASDRLRRLAENPLMLTIIALVHRVEAELPNERVKLYDKCTEALLATWEGIKGLPLSERERERPYYRNRRRWLEKLAFWMHTLPQEEERQAEVKRGDLKSKLVEFLLEDPKLNLSTDLAELEAEQFITLAKSRTGILIERGDGVYSFVHLTFQEYFAACDLEKRYITDLARLWEEIQPHLYDSHWREVILLLIGRLNDHDEPPSVIVEKILRERDKIDDVIHRNVFLAAACLADRVNVNETLRNEIVVTLLKFTRQRRDEHLQDDAFAALGLLSGNERAVAGLLALAQNAQVDAWVRLSAAQALGQLGRTDDAVRLLLALAQDVQVNAGVRSSAAQDLGQLGRTDDDVIHGLLALAQDVHVNKYVRSSAAQALGQLGQKNSAVARGLLEMTKSRNEEIRDYACQALNLVAGNLRYAELDNGQKRIKRTKRKAANRKRQAAGSKRKTKGEIPRSTRNDRTKNRKSKIRNPKS